MSLTAYIDGKKVFAKDMTDRTLPYTDEIGQPKRLARGKIRIPYFSYYPGFYSPFDYEPETEEHRMGKDYVEKLFKPKYPKTDVEVYFKDIQRKADVVVPERKTVIEVQCSSIPAREIIARLHAYSKAGYSMMWIFGAKNYLKVSSNCGFGEFRLKASEKCILDFCKCVCYVYNNQLFLCAFNPVERLCEGESGDYWKTLKTIKELGDIRLFTKGRIKSFGAFRMFDIEDAVSLSSIELEDLPIDGEHLQYLVKR